MDLLTGARRLEGISRSRPVGAAAGCSNAIEWSPLLWIGGLEAPPPSYTAHKRGRFSRGAGVVARALPRHHVQRRW